MPSTVDDREQRAYTLVKPCCGEPVRLADVSETAPSVHRVSCPDCPLALFGPFEWTAALRPQPGGGLAPHWDLRRSVPWAWDEQR